MLEPKDCFITKISRFHCLIFVLLVKLFIKIFIALFIFQPLNLCDIEQITSAIVTKEDEISQKIDIQLKDPDKEVNTYYIIKH